MFIPYSVDTEEPLEQQVPWALISLVALIVGMHAYLWVYLGEEARQDIFFSFGAMRFQYRYWEAFTCTLLHGSLSHMAGNAYFLYIYGATLERLIGWWKFLVVYFVGAFISIELHLLTVSPIYADEPAIGASGAISAVLGAFLILLPNARLDTLFFSVISFRPVHVRVPAWIILIIWFLGQLIYSLGLLGDVGNVAFWAHVGGFVAGAGMGQGVKFLRGQAVASLEEGLREPLKTAWDQALAGHVETTAKLAGEWREKPIPGAMSTQRLLAGLVDLETGGDRDRALQELLQAFGQARDYRDEGRILSVYLQLRQYFSPFEVPAAVHRDAAFAAVSRKQTQLALSAFHQAILGGLDERLGQTLSSLAAVLEQRCQRPDLARTVNAVREELDEADSA